MRSITPKTLIPDTVKRRRMLNFLKRIFVWIFVIVACFQLYRANQLLNSASSKQYNKSLSEIETLNEEITRLKEYLLIPGTEQPKNSEQINAFESELGQILKEYNQEQAQQSQYAKLNQIISENYPKNIPSNFSVTNNENSTYVIQTDQKNILSFGITNLKLFIQTPYSYTEYSTQQTTQYVDRIKVLTTAERLAILEKVYDRVLIAEEELSSLNKEFPDFIELLDQKSLVLMPLSQNPNSAIVSINTFDGNLAGSIGYSYAKGEYYALGQKSQEVSSRSRDLAAVVASLQTYFSLNSFESLLNKNIKDKSATILKYIESSNFQKIVDDSNLKYTVSDNETTIDYIFTNIATNVEAFRIYIDKTNGAIIYKKGDQTKKLSFKDSEINNSGTDKTYLIAGKHGALTDTMILANINEETDAVKLLSIPRDLYIDGQKINSVYAKEGMPALTAKLEQVTGLKIENYALIDMYAFIDVVDYLGGISVHLDHDIIDPTYKTFDNGVWGTMYFAAGDHTVNGKQALRLARSRHTTSDFDRAKRQQQILSAANNRLKELSLKDAKTIIQIAYTVLDKTETDLSPQKAITAYFKYKDFNISDQNVLSTANVLASTYSNEYLANNCKNCGKGAYILVPKNNDWSLVKTYVKQLIANS